MYHITVDNPHGVERRVQRLEWHGQEQKEHAVRLTDDGQTHEVRVLLG
jgi:hypothetical protein